MLAVLEGKVYYRRSKTVSILDLGDMFDIMSMEELQEDTGGATTNTTVDLSGLLDSNWPYCCRRGFSE